MIPRRVALHQEGPAAPDLVPHARRHPPERRVTGEQHEHAAVRRLRHLRDRLRDRRVVTRLVTPRIGKVGRHAEHALLPELERRRQHLGVLHRLGWRRESDAIAEEVERAAGGERRARHDDGFHAVEQ